MHPPFQCQSIFARPLHFQFILCHIFGTYHGMFSLGFDPLYPSTRGTYITVFENHRKSLIQHCERSELRLHDKKWQKVIHYGEFLKT